LETDVTSTESNIISWQAALAKHLHQSAASSTDLKKQAFFFYLSLWRVRRKVCAGAMKILAFQATSICLKPRTSPGVRMKETGRCRLSHYRVFSTRTPTDLRETYEFLDISSDFNPISATKALSPDDLAWGTMLALLLAVLATFLQSRRSQNDFVPSRIEPSLADNWRNSTAKTFIDNTTSATPFEEWKEISKPENYVWYNADLRAKQQLRHTRPSTYTFAQGWTLVALFVIFAPIFSFEFALTVSRQILCALERTQGLCDPYQ
jgi:hypothetical protein